MNYYETITLKNGIRFEKVLIAPYSQVRKHTVHLHRVHALLEYFKSYMARLKKEFKKDPRYDDVYTTCRDSIHVLSMCLRLDSKYPTEFGAIRLIENDTGITAEQNYKEYEPVIDAWKQLRQQVSPSRSGQPSPAIPRQKDIRRGCEGYMMLIRNPVNEILMSMTVWNTSDSSQKSQEHALIMKNFFATKSTIRFDPQLSILMHSYAAFAVRKPVIYCSPFPKMENILLTAQRMRGVHDGHPAGGRDPDDHVCLVVARSTGTRAHYEKSICEKRHAPSARKIVHPHAQFCSHRDTTAHHLLSTHGTDEIHVEKSNGTKKNSH